MRADDFLFHGFASERPNARSSRSFGKSTLRMVFRGVCRKYAVTIDRHFFFATLILDNPQSIYARGRDNRYDNYIPSSGAPSQDYYLHAYSAETSSLLSYNQTSSTHSVSSDYSPGMVTAFSSISNSLTCVGSRMYVNKSHVDEGDVLSHNVRLQTKISTGNGRTRSFH